MQKRSVGIVVWFKRHHDREYIENEVKNLRRLAFSNIRTNISWAEWHGSEKEQERISFYIKLMADNGFKILPCLNYTPPELGINPRTNSPPKDPELFGSFVEEVLKKLGHCFQEVQLWNEPNLSTDWDGELDPQGIKFTKMIASGSEAARAHGKRVALGGFTWSSIERSESNLAWLTMVSGRGILDHVDVLCVNGLRGTWSEKKAPEPWPNRARRISNLLASFNKAGIPIWITETGYSTISIRNDIEDLPHKLLEVMQVVVFADLVRIINSAVIECAYFYTLRDSPYSDRSVRHIITGWEDVLQHHYGIIRLDGSLKLLGEIISLSSKEHQSALNFVEKHGLWSLLDLAINRGEPY